MSLAYKHVIAVQVLDRGGGCCGRWVWPCPLAVYYFEAAICHSPPPPSPPKVGFHGERLTPRSALSTLSNALKWFIALSMPHLHC